MNKPDFYTNHGSTVTLPLLRPKDWLCHVGVGGGNLLLLLAIKVIVLNKKSVTFDVNNIENYEDNKRHSNNYEHCCFVSDIIRAIKPKDVWYHN